MSALVTACFPEGVRETGDLFVRDCSVPARMWGLRRFYRFFVARLCMAAGAFGFVAVARVAASSADTSASTVLRFGMSTIVPERLNIVS